jgi:hypothetical protein
LSFTSPSNAIFAGDHHVLISLAGPIGAPRWSFVIGVTAGQTATCSTATEGFSTSGSSQPYECQ